MPVIVIFTGHDGSRKTSIAKEFSKQMGVPYFKDQDEHRTFLAGKYGDSSLYFSQYYLAKFLEQVGCSVVMDRGFPDELVYGDVFDRDISRPLFWDVDAKWAKLGTFVVICEKLNLDGYQDPLITLENAFRVRAGFRKFSRLTECKCVLINTDEGGTTEIAGRIIKMLELFEVKD